MKKYLLRLYERKYVLLDDMYVGIILDRKDCNIIKSFKGKNDIAHIYDIECEVECLTELIMLGLAYFPLNNYDDFIITCPNCGNRIDDNMILNVYNDELLSGYNINCNRNDCGTQMAKVEFYGKMP